MKRRKRTRAEEDMIRGIVGRKSKRQGIVKKEEGRGSKQWRTCERRRRGREREEK